jgi:pimeloyl-ACP methyl ester carboxylesterase
MNEKNRWIKKRRWPWVIGGILLLIGLWQLFTNLYREEEKQLRRQLRETVKEKFPDQTAEFSKTLGLFYFEGDRETPRGVVPDRKSVVLVHGLDDPGQVWQNLAPVLVKEDFNVWLMQYPNDQPIVESARLFFEELQGLKQLGIDRISIVAHSMGGLVSREMLTRPEIEYNASAKNRRVPEVVALIMVGTPNHGSQLARLRVFTEMRDQLARLTKGQANWLGGILDGAGEAKIDLLPGSRFLTELNARPHPAGMDMLIIAGITSPWSETDINRWISDLRLKVSDDRQIWVDEFGKNMIALTHGLGDGLVTVESTRLEGVPHRTVDGTHLSMIRNITLGSRRIPPAVPIIIDQLKNVSASLRVKPKAFTGLFDRRITRIGLTGAAVTQGKEQKRRIDQACQNARACEPTSSGEPGNGYLRLGQGALNSDGIGQTDQTRPFGSRRNNHI